MGIKNLNSLIEKHSSNGKTKRHLSSFGDKVMAIDTNVYLYKYLYGKSNHIDGMFFMINKFKKFNIKPIFIFDGKPPNEKQDTIKNRKIIRDRLKEKLLNLEAQLLLKEDLSEIQTLKDEIENIEKKIMYVNKTVIDKTKELFDLMGITYVSADCEAEHYCSKLCKLDLVDGVVSEDMDTVACGSKLVIRNFTNKDDYVDCYTLDNILYDLDINYTSFIDLCILLGNDYNHRPRNLIPDEIYEIVKKHKSIENILNKSIVTNWKCEYQSIRDIILLKDININVTKLINQYNKKFNIQSLTIFLKNNSTIDEKTYRHRINLIFNNSRILAKKENIASIIDKNYGIKNKSYSNYNIQNTIDY